MADGTAPRPTLGCPCGEGRFSVWHSYATAPDGEVRFAFSQGRYRRDLKRCAVCGHMVSLHDMDMSGLYGGDYVSSTYSDAQGLRRTHDRIVALPPEKSDNRGRVARINRFAAAHFGDGSETAAPAGRTLLDVGSGLGVFPGAMAQAGWSCTALDPDPRAAAHIEAVARVPAVAAEFMSASPQRLGRFDVVTFNKVLEHVVAPVDMLAHGRAFAKREGFVYVELPDAAAAAEGPGREEFFIDHHHVFSPASHAMLMERAGFTLLALERLREPSGKFTLRAFAAPRWDAA